MCSLQNWSCAYIYYFIGGENTTVCFQTPADLNMLSGVRTNKLFLYAAPISRAIQINTAQFWCTMNFQVLDYKIQPSSVCPSLMPAYFNAQFRLKYTAPLFHLSENLLETDRILYRFSFSSMYSWSLDSGICTTLTRTGRAL